MAVGPAMAWGASVPESCRELGSCCCIGEVMETGCTEGAGCDTASGLGTVGVLCSLFCSIETPEADGKDLFVDGGCNMGLLVVI